MAEVAAAAAAAAQAFAQVLDSVTTRLAQTSVSHAFARWFPRPPSPGIGTRCGPISADLWQEARLHLQHSAPARTVLQQQTHGKSMQNHLQVSQAPPQERSRRPNDLTFMLHCKFSAQYISSS